MEAFPIYDFPQSPLELKTDLEAFSGDVESSFTGGPFLGTFDLGSGLTLPTNSGRGDSNLIPFDPFFSLQGTNFQHADLEFTSPDIPFGQNIFCAQERRNSLDRDVNFIPIESQAPSISHPVQWSAKEDGTSMKIGRQRYERSSSVNEESAACCPSHSQLSLTTSKSKLVPTTLPPSGNERMPSVPKREWSSMEAVINPTMPKRMRQRGPLIRSHIEISRRENNLRKRNANYDIPAGRNIKNIDELISQSTNEEEIKELKQQKRLLRNRQAAYAPFPSRHNQNLFMTNQLRTRLLAAQKALYRAVRRRK